MSKYILIPAKDNGQARTSVNLASGPLFLKTYQVKLPGLVKRIVSFYVDGFRCMTLGRTLWVIILIKLFIMFGILKIFFFSDYLHDNFSTDMERIDHVYSSLTKIPN